MRNHKYICLYIYIYIYIYTNIIIHVYIYIYPSIGGSFIGESKPQKSKSSSFRGADYSQSCATHAKPSSRQKLYPKAPFRDP